MEIFILVKRKCSFNRSLLHSVHFPLAQRSSRMSDEKLQLREEWSCDCERESGMEKGAGFESILHPQVFKEQPPADDSLLNSTTVQFESKHGARFCSHIQGSGVR